MNNIFKNYFLLLVVLVSQASSRVDACTSFICKQKLVHAFDWSTDQVGVVFSPPNVKRSNETLFHFGVKNSWHSQYASYTFAIFGKNLPQAGMNEKGLVVAGLLQNNDQYPEYNKNINVVNELQFIQYMLDTCATTKEVVETLSSGKLQVQKDFIAMHYLVYDAHGQVAIIEFIDRQVVVIDQPEIEVLTNDLYSECYGAFLFDTQDDNENSKRFCAAARAINNGDEPDDVFSQIKRRSSNTITELIQQVPYRTRWKIVFDPKEKEIVLTVVNKEISVAYSFSKMPISNNVIVNTADNAEFMQASLVYTQDFYTKLAFSCIGQHCLGLDF